MTKLNQSKFDEHFFALREMGCAVIALTPDDIQSAIGTDENDDYIVTVDEACTWLRDNQDDVEEAILGDYWGNTIHDLKSWTDRKTAEGIS